MRKLKAMVLACAIVISLVLPTAAADAPSEWAATAVTEANELKIIPEGLNGAYQQPITRAEFAQVAMYFCAAQYNVEPLNFVSDYRAAHAGDGEVEMDIDWKTFSDVRLGESENIWPIYAAAFGVVAGCGDGTFNPDGEITRQEAAVMLASAYKLYAGEVVSEENELRFTDRNEIADWALDAVEIIVSMGVMVGVDENRFAPNEPYTREQCYTTFMALYKNAPVSKYHKNVPGLFTPEEYVDYLTEGRMTPFTIEETFECESAYIIYGWSMSMSSSEARLLVVYRNGMGGYYGKSFAYPVSSTRSVRYELKDFELKEDILSFCVTPTEVPADRTMPVEQTCRLDILSGELSIIANESNVD